MIDTRSTLEVSLLDLARARLSAAGQDDRDADLLLLRLERHGPELLRGLAPLYGPEAGGQAWLQRLIDVLVSRHVERPEQLRLLDARRTLRPDWLLSPQQLGYVLYVDRYAGTLRGLAERLDHLEALGVTYLHLMPLLAPRPGDSDGGYAVADYRAVDPALGTAEELEALAGALRERGISLCIDLVLNHVAREHAWAAAARAGDPRYQGYFWLFEDRAQPDRYERTLPEVFPAFAPGNFTFDEELGRWVWTTFNAFQWDLNWSNPEVFLEFADLVLYWANRGVEVLRLDAIAFTYKRLGTDCQNQPEVHALVQALRAVARIAAPALAFKAEAIVGPEQLIHYLGRGEHHGKLSDLAYHNSLMVQTWSALATRRADLMTRALAAFPDKPRSCAWATYLRCHDDIGWAVRDEDAAAVGLDGAAHRRFLADYYTGAFPGSHARGGLFQDNPRTGDRRSCGTTASLAGLELGLQRGDDELIDLSIERVLLAHAIALAFGGLPLIYMGDEVGLLNDPSFRADPHRRGDNRWMHRPAMDWERVGRRAEPGSVEARLFDGLRALIRARKRTPQLHAAEPARIIDLDQPHVFCFARPHPEGDLLALFNVTEQEQTARLPGLGRRIDRISGRAVLPRAGSRLTLAAYERLWLVAPGALFD